MTKLIRGLRDRLIKHQQYNNTVRELSQLSDRDLNDLGIHRSNIECIARESVASRMAARRAA